jgi:hypothetical protein
LRAWNAKMLEDKKIKNRQLKISEEEVKDDVIKHYDSVIRESSLWELVEQNEFN